MLIRDRHDLFANMWALQNSATSQLGLATTQFFPTLHILDYHCGTKGPYKMEPFEEKVNLLSVVGLFNNVNLLQVNLNQYEMIPCCE